MRIEKEKVSTQTSVNNGDYPRDQHGRVLKEGNGTSQARGGGSLTKGKRLVEYSQGICKGETLRNLRGYQSKV